MIVLLTDFGLSDPYVGQMKGALISNAPDCRIVDLSHDVTPYGIAQAAFFLDASQPHFPEGTLFMVVVDPGVGSSRRILCLEAHSKLFLAPDNGLLGLLVEDADADTSRIFDFSHPHLAAASNTFHGRDVFAPLAAKLSAGDSPESLGREISLDSIVKLDWSAPEHDGQTLRAHALHVDHFGNVVCNLRIHDWNAILNGPMEISTGVAKLPVRRVRTYCEIERGTIGLIPGSQGFFELAMNMGSAGDLLSLVPGENLTLRMNAAS